MCLVLKFSYSLVAPDCNLYFFLIHNLKAIFFHWVTDAAGVGGITGAKAIFSPFLLIQAARLFHFEGLLLVWFSIIARKGLVSFENRNIRVAIGTD